ncbi:hypothetical protein [Nitratireductor sp. StC3]|uniref:hypothetical protein n=1 Tax=Nitratireductor sp. StC3 TaxID=2126741 RepID=UPI0011B1CD7B|nr:hypothetical protein [Nitratireductor sp. StC3]
MAKPLPKIRRANRQTGARHGGCQMQTLQDERTNRQIITIYAPIFMEKLERLERRGQGHCLEAVELRKTLALIDRAQARSHLEHDARRFSSQRDGGAPTRPS